jgi:hypothetical protein
MPTKIRNVVAIAGFSGLFKEELVELCMLMIDGMLCFPPPNNEV